MRRAVTRLIPLSCASFASEEEVCDMFSEKVERVGDLMKEELVDSRLPCPPPRENVERVGEGLLGTLWLDVNAMLRYLSPGSSILSRGLQIFWSVPLKSVGARMVRRDGKPELTMDLDRMSVAFESSGFVISQ
jgi:hypothetical protein